MIAQITTVTTKIGDQIATLTYQLLSRPARAEVPMTEYGVCAELFLPGMPADTAAIPAITCDETRILTLLTRITAGRVTPVALFDVVHDFLAQE